MVWETTKSDIRPERLWLVIGWAVPNVLRVDGLYRAEGLASPLQVDGVADIYTMLAILWVCEVDSSY